VSNTNKIGLGNKKYSKKYIIIILILIQILSVIYLQHQIVNTSCITKELVLEPEREAVLFLLSTEPSKIEAKMPLGLSKICTKGFPPICLFIEYRYLLYYDLDPLKDIVNKGYKISKAELVLVIENSTASDSSYTISICSLKNDWDEYASFSNRKKSVKWDTPGGDIGTCYAKITLGNMEGTSKIHADITELVMKWVNGQEKNYGIILYVSDCCGITNVYTSKSGNGPIIRVEYKIPEVNLEVSKSTIELKQGEETTIAVSVSAKDLDGKVSLHTDIHILNLNVDFEPKEGTPPYTSSMRIKATDKLKPGTYKITIVACDETGKFTKTKSITVKVISKFPIDPMLIAAGIGILIILLGIILALMKLRKKPKPLKLMITPPPTALVADGSQTTLTITLLDEKNNPTPAPQDIMVNLKATSGSITPQAIISKGSSYVTVQYQTPTQPATVTITAEAKNVRPATITLQLGEKRRYCMHCGAVMPPGARRCPRCGLMPPSGADTKVCPNCGAVIPETAKYCPECGARQP